jgi:dihydropteroate synthase
MVLKRGSEAMGRSNMFGRILCKSDVEDISRLMSEIGVTREGAEIMSPKAVLRIIRIDGVRSYLANILKQEMLSLGGDVAIARDAITGRAKYTDCLILGSLSQLRKLSSKLRMQPFNLGKLGDSIAQLLEDFQRDQFRLRWRSFDLRLGRRTYLMGILNLTPDSFSGNGIYAGSYPKSPKKAIEETIRRARQMVEDGADIIDIGGQSTRPGARVISAKDEIRRVVGAIKKLSRNIKVPISIDTSKSEVARAALDAGASMINDIYGLRKDRRLAKLASDYGVPVVVMHIKGTPATMQKNPQYKCLIKEILLKLRESVQIATDAGLNPQQIIVDPGIGFGKTLEHNLQILRCIEELKSLGQPILIGPSRKSFIGAILKAPPGQRLMGTVTSCILAVTAGAHILRVHDVREVKQACLVADSILKS